MKLFVASAPSVTYSLETSNNPLSVSIVVVTKKKINNKKAISAIEPALTSGADLLAIIYFLIIFLAPETIIDNTATDARM